MYLAYFIDGFWCPHIFSEAIWSARIAAVEKATQNRLNHPIDDYNNQQFTIHDSEFHFMLIYECLRLVWPHDHNIMNMHLIAPAIYSHDWCKGKCKGSRPISRWKTVVSRSWGVSMALLHFFIPSIVLSHVSASWNTYLWSCPIPTYSNTSSQPHVSQDCRGFHLLIMATLSVLGKASCSQHWENTILQVERFPLRIIVCGEQWGQPMKINKFIIYSETSPF